MTNDPTSPIDDLPQLAASSTSLRLQRLAEEGGVLGRLIAWDPFGVAKAAAARHVEGLRDQAALAEYGLLAGALGATRETSYKILRMAQHDVALTYGYREAGQSPTILEIEHATELLRGLMSGIGVPMTVREVEARRRSQLERLSARVTVTLARVRPPRCGCPRREAPDV
ncbi:hypothetical protein [Streptomyces aureus]|uniref:hypothetical protein n=1 Tax=Streptomyces aureus TaxID=193461 RepID=UPI0005686283|nr:hypothetical protein [Streptomyces aureus]